MSHPVEPATPSNGRAGGDTLPGLSPAHSDILRRGSGIADEVIAARGYRTVIRAADLLELGFVAAQCRVPGLLLPLHTTGGDLGPYVYRPDVPRSVDDKKRHRLSDGTYPQKVIKYELPRGAGVRVDCPPPCLPALGDPGAALWITEGQKKADALASHGLCAIALLGVWNFKGRNAFGGTTLLADFDCIAWADREVRIVFDSDVMAKPSVRQALDRLTEHLRRRRARVAAVYLPPTADGRKNGVDDWLAAGNTVEALAGLAEAPRVAARAAAPLVELLDQAPARLDRPLRLVDGRAYAATWLYARVTRSETLDRQGNVVRHVPPLVTNEQRLFVVRDDGRVFGEGGDADLDQLGLDLHLAEVPPTPLLWSAAGVKAYRGGRRPDPVALFERLVDVVDHFVDFSRSLAPQRTMAEMIACYALASWFLDAFTVIGFLWPNGDRGSGKTQLILVVARLAYLGHVITAAGTFPCLRDLSDYGATLAFDDAENLADARQTDPDKRTLLLAGNRRGSTIPLKELGSDKNWHTRYVNTYCPRLFSATRMPDPILASRTIIVPLIRTSDRSRANVDPEDPTAWPHPRQELIDDLWALALANLPAVRAYESQVNGRARLAGRNLEPWRALLAVAAWLDDRDTGGRLRRVAASGTSSNGAGGPRSAPAPAQTGLFARLEALSHAYQRERASLEAPDLTALTIRALCHCATSATRATSATCLGDTTPRGTYSFSLTTAEVLQAMLETTADEEVPREFITATRVGNTLSAMRLQPEPRPGGRGSRRWRVVLADLARSAAAYGLADLADALRAEGAATP